MNGMILDRSDKTEQVDSPEEDCGIGSDVADEERHEGEYEEEEDVDCPYSYQIDDGVGDACSVPSGNSIRSIIPSKSHPPPRMEEWLQIFSVRISVSLFSSPGISIRYE